MVSAPLEPPAPPAPPEPPRTRRTTSIKSSPPWSAIRTNLHVAQESEWARLGMVHLTQLHVLVENAGRRVPHVVHCVVVLVEVEQAGQVQRMLRIHHSKWTTLDHSPAFVRHSEKLLVVPSEHARRHSPSVHSALRFS